MSFDYKRYDIPKLFWNKKFEPFPDKEALIRAGLDFLINPKARWCFYLFGNPGAGKSHFSISLLKYFIDNLKNLSAGFVTSNSYVNKISAAMNANQNVSNLLTSYFERDLLLVDDIGNNRSSEWQKEKIHELLEERYNNVKKTIISSNLPPEEFGKVYGARLYDRIIIKGTVMEVEKSKFLDSYINCLEQKNETEGYIHTDH